MDRDTERMSEWFNSIAWERDFADGEDIEDMLYESGLSPADSGIVVDQDCVDYEAVFCLWEAGK